MKDLYCLFKFWTQLILVSHCDTKCLLCKRITDFRGLGTPQKSLHSEPLSKTMSGQMTCIHSGRFGKRTALVSEVPQKHLRSLRGLFYLLSRIWNPWKHVSFPSYCNQVMNWQGCRQRFWSGAVLQCVGGTKFVPSVVLVCNKIVRREVIIISLRMSILNEEYKY